MAHELSVAADGRLTLARRAGSDRAWMEDGRLYAVEVPDGADMAEWLAAAGLAFTIESAPVYYRPACEYPGRDGLMVRTARPVPDRVVQHRSDNGAPLGIVSADYQTVQWRDLAEGMMLAAERMGARPATMGALFGGRRAWCMAETDDSAYVIDRRDTHKRNLLLATSCDGTLATTGRFTDVRVVCNNTLSCAIGGSKAEFTVRHSTRFDPGSVPFKLNLETAETFRAQIEMFRRFAAVRVDRKTAEAATVAFLNPDKGADPDAFASTLRSQKAGRILALFNGRAKGADMDGVHGTAYGLLNAMTEFVDHESTVHRGEYSQDRRVQSAWFGAGMDNKRAALELCTVLERDAPPAPVAMPGSRTFDLNRLFNLPGGNA